MAIKFKGVTATGGKDGIRLEGELGDIEFENVLAAGTEGSGISVTPGDLRAQLGLAADVNATDLANFLRAVRGATPAERESVAKKHPFWKQAIDKVKDPTALVANVLKIVDSPTFLDALNLLA